MSILYLISLGIVMTLSTFAVGIIPIFINVRAEYMDRITVFGAGLLIGTALGVIVPEGTIVILKSLHGSQHLVAERVVALCLISGFTGMMVIEYFTSIFTHKRSQVTVANNLATTTAKNSKNTNAMIGILIHSMADGVALASVAMSDHATLEIIVFLAIIIHKLPSAFGISCFLMGNGESMVRIKRFQMLFSISAVRIYL